MGAKRQELFSGRSFCTGGQSWKRSSMFTKWLLKTEEWFIAISNTVELNSVNTQETVATLTEASISKMWLLMIN
jgi:hypothetical protein